MIFRQLFESTSSSYTYLLACQDSKQAMLIDPVLETIDRDLHTLSELGLTLSYTVETHIHADHLTGARKLKHLTGCNMAGPAQDRIPCRDIGLEEGKPLVLGGITLQPIFSPGHTDAHHAYVVEDATHQMLFSGDALLIDGCGRTDFQSGSAEALYNSIHQKFFVLPGDTLVYPAHDYNGRRVTTIEQERTSNARLGKDKPMNDFIVLMASLKLPYPQRMEFAVPGNQRCGECPEEAPIELKQRCSLDPQG